MTNPLIEKWEELNKPKEEPQTAFELATNFKEAIDKQKEDKIRYLASLPQSTISGNNGTLPQSTISGNIGTGITASNYISTNNSSVSYTPYRPIKTYDTHSTKDAFMQVADKVKDGTAKVLNMTMEMDMVGSFAAGKKMTFEVYVYD